jgi:outer membrane protein TolC
VEGILTHAVEVSRAKFEAGTQSQADLLTAEVERQRILVARRELERQVTEQANKLQLAMNRDPFAPLGRPTIAELGAGEPPAERLRALILTNRPEVRQAEAQRVEALAKLQLAKRQWIPDPALVVQAQRYNQASQAVSELDAGFSVGLPWFNREKYRAGEREAQSGIAAAQAAQDARRTEALALLRDQLQKLETLRQNAALYRDQLAPTARLAVAAQLANYQTDKATLLQVLSSEQSWRDLQSAYQQNLADYQAAQAELEALVGAEVLPLGLERPSRRPPQK